MALKINWDFHVNGGFSAMVEDAYCKVVNINGNKNSIAVTVWIMTRNDIADPVTVFSSRFEPLLTGENIIAQAYMHLKTLPEFADAEDC